MTDIAPVFPAFPAISGKKVTAAFDGGKITSNAGVLLLAQAEKRLGIAPRLAALFPDERDPTRVQHLLPDILLARYLAIAAGYEDANDLDDRKRQRNPLYRSAIYGCNLVMTSGPSAPLFLSFFTRCFWYATTSFEKGALGCTEICVKDKIRGPSGFDPNLFAGKSTWHIMPPSSPKYERSETKISELGGNGQPLFLRNSIDFLGR